VTNRRRHQGRVRQDIPARRSRPNPAPAARKNRPAPSYQQRRAAAARQAAARRLRAAVIGTAVVILIVVGVLAFRGRSSPAAGVVSNPAAFSLPTLNGSGLVRLASYRGKPVVVNFFASWCTQCQAELPGFRQEAVALKGKVTFIGVDSLETGDKNFLPGLFHLAGPFAALASDVGPNGNDLHAALGGGNTMPMTAFYDANGSLLDVERGALVPVSTLEQKIAQLYGVTG
jgi:cytochrome c biogenesis protein CcmG, thiol:disulfide interchange protein DsbE